MNYDNVYAAWEAEGCPRDQNNSVPHEIKMYYLYRSLRDSGARTFVESGTCYGTAVQAMLPYVDTVHTVEAFTPCYDHCVSLFEGDPRVNLYFGDSGKLLPEILEVVGEVPAVFWLDAHYSGDGTALLDKETPIVAELDAIYEAAHSKYSIVIDDARGFGVWQDYPTIEWMEEYCAKKFPLHRFFLEGDEIFVVPA